MRLRWLGTLVSLSLGLLGAMPAMAQDVWSDGSPSRLQHRCVFGLADQIEDLTWTWVGFLGQPEVGTVYYARIRVGSLGCSGAYVRPEVRLPAQTTFAIDSAHQVHCYVENN